MKSATIAAIARIATKIAAIAAIARPLSYGEWIWSLIDLKCTKKTRALAIAAIAAIRIANLAVTE